jgi:hypothetical protein
MTPHEIKDKRIRCSRMTAVPDHRSKAAFHYFTDLPNNFVNALPRRAHP